MLDDILVEKMEYIKWRCLVEHIEEGYRRILENSKLENVLIQIY